MGNYYYENPPQHIFDEVKKRSVEIWETYDNRFGYVDEKKNILNRLKNESANFMTMVSMFDISNQKRLSDMLSEESKKHVRGRLVAGGTPEFYIVF
jgi:hypothetical protein